MSKDKSKENLPLLFFMADKDNTEDAAVRVFAKGATSEVKNQVAYMSTRLGTVTRANGGYVIEIKKEWIGNTFELKKVVSKKIISGEINPSTSLGASTSTSLGASASTSLGANASTSSQPDKQALGTEKKPAEEVKKNG